MELSCSMIIALMVILVCYTCEDNTPSLPNLISSECVKRYAITHRFYIGYPVTPKILTCRCHCDKNIALRRFWQSIQHLTEDCKRSVRELRGFCFETVQENLLKLTCPKGGFAFCLVKVSAIKTYYFKTYDYQRSAIRLTYSRGQKIDVPVSKNNFAINGVNYEFFVNGLGCDKTDLFIRSYENIRDDNDTWLETCETDSFSDKFLNVNALSRSRNYDYNEILYPRITYTSGVCNGNITAFSLNNISKEELTICNKVRQNLYLFDINDTTAFAYQNISVSIFVTNRNENAEDNADLYFSYTPVKCLFVIIGMLTAAVPCYTWWRKLESQTYTYTPNPKFVFKRKFI